MAPFLDWLERAVGDFVSEDQQTIMAEVDSGENIEALGEDQYVAESPIT